MTIPSPQPAKGGIRYTDRVFVGGVNGSGKSVLINHLATRFRCQRFLYDTKDEFTVPGVDAVHRISQIDWRAPVIHFIDTEGDLDETNRLFRLFWQRRIGRDPTMLYGLIVVVHELADLCGDQPGATPKWVSNYIRKGRAHGLGMINGSQRPRNIPRAARSECQHVFSFAGGFDPEDVPVMAKMHRLTVPQYEKALAQAAEISEHAFLWGDRRARTNVIRPSLPPHLANDTLAVGIDPSRHRREPEPEPEPTELDGQSSIQPDSRVA
jgi:hypothetical protein